VRFGVELLVFFPGTRDRRYDPAPVHVGIVKYALRALISRKRLPSPASPPAATLGVSGPDKSAKGNPLDFIRKLRLLEVTVSDLWLAHS